MHIPNRRSLEAVDGLLSPLPTKRHSPPLGSVRARLARLLTTFDAYRRDRRAAAELTAFDDHLLADIGLKRTDLPHVRRMLWPADPWWRAAGHGPR